MSEEESHMMIFEGNTSGRGAKVNWARQDWGTESRPEWLEEEIGRKWQKMRPKRQGGSRSQIVLIFEATVKHSDLTPSMSESHWRVLRRGMIINWFCGLISIYSVRSYLTDRLDGKWDKERSQGWLLGLLSDLTYFRHMKWENKHMQMCSSATPFGDRASWAQTSA